MNGLRSPIRMVLEGLESIALLVLAVALIQPNEHLCLSTWKDEQDLADCDPATLGVFSLYLVRESDDSCRFVVRTCKQERRPRTRGARFIATLLEDPLDLVMEQRMLRTVRRLAERRHG